MIRDLRTENCPFFEAFAKGENMFHLHMEGMNTLSNRPFVVILRLDQPHEIFLAERRGCRM